MKEHRGEVTFEKVFDAVAHEAGFEFVNDEKPVVGTIVPKLVNRRGAVHIDLRDPADFSEVGDVFFSSLEFFASCTDTYKEVIATGKSMSSGDLLHVPSLRKLVETLGSRAVLQAVRLEPSEELILDHPLRALEQERSATSRRTFSDTVSLIG